MVNTDITSSWVYEHFLMYLFICIADVDCLISDKELSKIQKKALANIDKERCTKLVSEVFKEYRAHTVDERKEYIKENVPNYLRTNSIRQRVINSLSEIIADHSDSENLEQVMFRYIRKIINVTE
jgi:hypothetical protein